MCAVNSKHGPKVVTADTADTTDMNLTTQFSDYTLVGLKIKNQHSAVWLEMLSNVLFCSIVLSCTNLCSTVENLCKYSNDIHFLTKSCHVLHVLHTSTSASQVFGILGTKMWESGFPTLGLSARTVPPMMPESPPQKKATLSVLRIAVSWDKTLSVLQVTEGDWRGRAWTPLPPSPS